MTIERDDAELVAAALIRGARWEPFPGGNMRAGEFCMQGLRYATRLNEKGVPELHESLRMQVVAFLGSAPDTGGIA